jgi:hypothetical protein
MFFIKKKEIVLDCFTYLPYVYDCAKINHASKYLPEWWRNTPEAIDGNPTIKHCAGLMDFFKTGIILPSWFEMELSIGKLGEEQRCAWQASNTDVDTGSSHTPAQFEGFANTDGNNIKLTSPWLFKTKEDINFTWTQPTWNMRKLLNNITLLPAVVNFKYQHVTNVNLFVINKEEAEICKILPLTPLAILHPLTEKKVIVKNHLVSKDEWERHLGLGKLILKRHPKEWISLYKTKKDLHKKIENINRCPIDHA